MLFAPSPALPGLLKCWVSGDVLINQAVASGIQTSAASACLSQVHLSLAQPILSHGESQDPPTGDAEMLMCTHVNYWGLMRLYSIKQSW